MQVCNYAKQYNPEQYDQVTVHKNAIMHRITMCDNSQFFINQIKVQSIHAGLQLLSVVTGAAVSTCGCIERSH